LDNCQTRPRVFIKEYKYIKNKKQKRRRRKSSRKHPPSLDKIMREG
jgi:hypothetical protein